MRRLHLLKNRFARRSPKIPLRLIPLLPYVLLLVGTVGCIEYLCVRSQEIVTRQLAEQLIAAQGDRVNHYLEEYLATPALIDRLNANAIRLGQVDVADPKSLERHLLQQIQAFERVSRIRFSNPQGGLVSAGNDNRGLTVASTDGFVRGTLRVHGVNRQGQRTKLFVKKQNYDASQRPFHQIALKAGKPTWTSIYTYIPAANGLGIATSYPLYDKAHRLQGVLSSDLMLAAIDKFLGKLKIGTRGTVYIMERSGLLVASATGKPAFTSADSGQARRLKATVSDQIQIRQTAQHLLSHFKDLTKINTPTQLHFEVEGERQFLQVNPFRDRFGLDWLIVVTVPEADFTGQIDANRRTTILLTAGVLAGAIALGLLITHYITRSIRQLSQASHAMARGEWQRVKEDSAIAEIDVLARAFNQMATQLQQLFQRVNAALQESQEKFATIFRSSPDAVCIIALPQECYLKVNDRFLELTGYSRQEILGRPAFELNPFGNSILLSWLRHSIEKQQTIRNFEFDFCSKTGQTRITLLSVEVMRLEGQQCLLFLFKDITDRKSLEIALHRSNAKLNDILNNAIASISCLRVYANFTWEHDFWSQGCETVFGYTAEELMANPALWASRILPEDMENVLMPKFSSLFAEQDITCEYRFLHKDGTLRWIGGTCSSRRDAALDCWLVTTVAMDNTARKQAETALQESERRLSTLISNLPGYVYRVANDRNYTTHFISESVVSVTEYQQEEYLVARTISCGQEIHSEDAEAVWDLVQQALESRQPYECEYRIITKSGKQKWVWERGRGIWADSGVLYLEGFVTDINERKQAEAALRQSEQRFRSVFNTSAVPMGISSLEGKIWQANPALCQMLGYSETELVELTFQQITYPEDLGINLEYARQALAGEISYYRLEKRYLHKDGRIIWALLSASIVRDSQQQPLYSVALIQDITARKQAEAALRQQVQQEQLLRLITQRIRQSLDLDEILTVAAIAVRQTLQVDRVLIFQLISEGTGFVRKESVAAEYPLTAIMRLEDKCLSSNFYDYYRQGKSRVVPNVTTDDWAECLLDFMQEIGVKSKVVIPIAQNGEDGLLRVWGLLIVHSCSYYRHWQPHEVKLLQQIANQLAIAIQQADLYQQVQSELTERKQAQEALQNSEERFREAFANAPSGMALVSLKGSFLKVNRSLCHIVGYSEAELLALNDRAITHPDDLETSLEAIRQMLAGEIRFHQMEKRYLHKQGNTVQVLWSLSLASDRDKRSLYFISQVQDITERQAIDRMKNQLISIVSHELRTPLTAICGSLGLLATGIYDNKPEKAKRMIEIALIDSERLTRLVNHILDIERLDSGSVQMVMEVCAAGNLMQQAVETVQAIAAQHSILLSATPTSARVWATPDYILQVLTNLLDNAIKFSPPGSTVWLSAEVMSDDQLQVKRQQSQAEGFNVVAGEENSTLFLASQLSSSSATNTTYVLFQVKDRGRGIPADKLESIFGRFQQVDVSDSRQKGGTGLGLAICKSIVQQHGGSIWVESILGEGSAFYFTLPVPDS